MVGQKKQEKKTSNIEDKPLMLFVTKNEDTVSHVIFMLLFFYFCYITP